MFGEDALVYYYKLNSWLTIDKILSLTEIENMMPWERDVYVNLYTEHIKRQKELEQ